LKAEYPPIQAATIASLIASSFAYLAINLIVRRIHVSSWNKVLVTWKSLEENIKRERAESQRYE